jgi:hypothetical protein
MTYATPVEMWQDVGSQGGKSQITYHESVIVHVQNKILALQKHQKKLS